MLFIILIGIALSFFVILSNCKAKKHMRNYFTNNKGKFFGISLSSAPYVKILCFVIFFGLLAFIFKIVYYEAGYLLASYVTVIAPLLYRSFNLLSLSAVLGHVIIEDKYKKGLFPRLIEIFPDLVVLALSVSMMADFISARNKITDGLPNSSVVITICSAIIFFILLLLYFVTVARVIIIEDELQLRIKKQVKGRRNR